MKKSMYLALLLVSNLSSLPLMGMYLALKRVPLSGSQLGRGLQIRSYAQRTPKKPGKLEDVVKGFNVPGDLVKVNFPNTGPDGFFPEDRIEKTGWFSWFKFKKNEDKKSGYVGRNHIVAGPFSSVNTGVSIGFFSPFRSLARLVYWLGKGFFVVGKGAKNYVFPQHAPVIMIANNEAIPSKDNRKGKGVVVAGDIAGGDIISHRIVTDIADFNKLPNDVAGGVAIYNVEDLRGNFMKITVQDTKTVQDIKYEYVISYNGTVVQGSYIGTHAGFNSVLEKILPKSK